MTPVPALLRPAGRQAARTVPRSWVVGALVAAAGVSGVVTPGASRPAVAAVPTGAPVSDQRAVTLLRTSYAASREVRYEGTAFVGMQGTYARVRITHVPGKGTYVSPVGGGAVDATLQPDRATEPDGDDPLAMLADHFTLSYTGTARMAGRSAFVVAVTRPDAGGVAARFWVDQRTGVMLARSAYDDDGDEYEQVMFTSISVSESAGTAGPAPRRPAVEGRLAAAGTAGAAAGAAGALRSAGWQVRGRLPGGFELYDARLTGGGRAAVLHLSYTDGLSSLSLFEQRGRLADRALAGWRPVEVAGRTVYVDASSPQRLAWQGDDTVYALLSDAAPARVAAAVAALPYGAPPDGVMDRMMRGFDRLGSWIDPFG